MVKRTMLMALGMAAVLTAHAQQADTVRAESVYPYNTFDTYRIGGYGEMVAAWKDYGINRFSGVQYGNAKKDRAAIAIPRFVVAFDYKLSPKWILGAEIEFESGGTGTALELENTENGEYETEIEKGGEVALEQFHVTRLIIPAFNVRVGHMIVPVGLTNSHHEPNMFFGTVRPEGETTLLPSTWHETGVEFFGTFGKGLGRFNYQAMIVAGLNANGFDRNAWAGGAKQGFFETDNFTAPAYVARLDWRGVKGLRVGASVYHCANIGANADKYQTYEPYGKIPLTIWSADAQYTGKYVTARANIINGHLSKADKVSDANGMLSNKSPYSRLTPVAERAVTYGGEIGFNLAAISGMKKCPVLYPFARYEYYNPQERVAGNHTADLRLQTSLWVAGINWQPLSGLVVKADYTTRQIGTGKVFGRGAYNSENEFAVGVAFTGWLLSK